MSNEVNPIHTYDDFGDYTVVLTAFNDCGEEIVEDQVIVSSLPVANFVSNIQNGDQGPSASLSRQDGGVFHCWFSNSHGALFWNHHGKRDEFQRRRQQNGCRCCRS